MLRFQVVAGDSHFSVKKSLSIQTTINNNIRVVEIYELVINTDSAIFMNLLSMISSLKWTKFFYLSESLVGLVLSSPGLQCRAPAWKQISWVNMMIESANFEASTKSNVSYQYM